MRITKLIFETTPVTIDFMANGYRDDNGYKGLTIHQAKRWHRDVWRMLGF